MHKIYQNFLIASVSRAVTGLIGLVIIGFLTRYLGQEGYGAFETILSYLFIFTVLADFGLHVIHVREISRYPEKEKYISGNMFTLRLVSLVSVIALALVINVFLPYSQEIKTGILIAAIFVLFSSLSQIISGIFQKHSVFYFVSFADVFTRLIQLGLVFWAIKAGLDFIFFVWILSLTAAIQFFIIYFISRKFVKFSLGLDFPYARKIIKASLPIALSILFTAIYIRTDALMLSLMKPIADVGIYRLAAKMLEAIVFFPALLVELTMPTFSSLAFKSKELLQPVFKRTFNILVIIAVPIVVYLFTLSEQIILLVGGSGFLASALPLQILALVVGMVFLNNLGGKVLIALELQKAGMWIYIFGAILNIAANLIAIPKYSYLGASAATLLTEILVTAMMFSILSAKARLFPEKARMLKSVAAGVFMALAIYQFKEFNIAIPVLLGFAVYAGMLYLLGGIKKEEIKKLFQPQRV